jgi:hypothetical protein
MKNYLSIYIILALLNCSCESEPPELQPPLGKWEVNSINKRVKSFHKETSLNLFWYMDTWVEDSDTSYYLNVDSVEYIEFFEDQTWLFQGTIAVNSGFGVNCKRGRILNQNGYLIGKDYPVEFYCNHDSVIYTYKSGYFKYRKFENIYIKKINNAEFDDYRSYSEITVYCKK